MLTAASRPFGSACISAPGEAVTLDDLICMEISVSEYAGRYPVIRDNYLTSSSTKLSKTADEVDVPTIGRPAKTPPVLFQQKTSKTLICSSTRPPGRRPRSPDGWQRDGLVWAHRRLVLEADSHQSLTT